MNKYFTSFVFLCLLVFSLIGCGRVIDTDRIGFLKRVYFELDANQRGAVTFEMIRKTDAFQFSNEEIRKELERAFSDGDFVISKNSSDLFIFKWMGDKEIVMSKAGRITNF